MRAISVAASLLLGALCLALSSAVVEAHGDEVLRERAGAYEIVVALLPERAAVGIVHFSITPLDATDGRLVERAKIWITAHDEHGRPEYAARALNLPSEPDYYHANIKFESAGPWTIELTLEHETMGAAEISFPLEIQPAAIGAGAVGGLIFLLVCAALLGGAVHLWLSARRSASSRRP